MNLFAWIASCESAICASAHEDCRKSPPTHLSELSIQSHISVFNFKGGRADSGVDLITVARGGGCCLIALLVQPITCECCN